MTEAKTRRPAAGRLGVKPSSRTAAEREAGFTKATQIMLVSLFSLLAFIFYYGFARKADFLSILLMCAAAWLAFEVVVRKPDVERLKRAFLVGLFLMGFDFAVETAGAMLELWRVYYSALPVGFVPGEIMALCIIGGSAWALYLPSKGSPQSTMMDVFVFAVFGAVGEFVFTNAGIMRYFPPWNTGFAFAAYAVTFGLLHYVRKKIMG